MSFYVDVQASHVSQISYLSRMKLSWIAQLRQYFCFDPFCTKSWKILLIILFFHIREMLQ